MKRISKLMVAVLFVLAIAGTAFATNPFADVEKGSWVYDSLSYCASQGLVSGYTDGSFKGDQSLTRYEAASVVQRAFQKLDETKADKKAVEELKKLAIEFKSELEALGTKTEKIDKRVSVLEKGIGTWNISGTLRFDAKMVSGDMKDTGHSGWTSTPGSDEWTKERAQLYFRKQIAEETFFSATYRIGGWANKGNKRYLNHGHYGRGESNEQTWVEFYVKTKLPFYGIDATVGRFFYDFENEAGLIADANAMFGGYFVDGFRFDKVWNKLKATAVVGRNSSAEYQFDPYVAYNEYYTGSGQYTYALNLKYDFNDRAMLGLSGYIHRFDNQMTVNTLGVYGRYNLTKEGDLSLRGIYYWQKASEYFAPRAVDSKSHTAFKAAFTAKQANRFTGLHIEYANFSNGFAGGNLGGDYTAINSYTPFDTYSQISLLNNKPLNEKRTDLFFVKLEQQWKNKKWSTFERFAWADFNTTGLSNAKEWGVGINYKMTPAIKFTLAYDSVDYGDNTYEGDTAYGRASGFGNVLQNRDNVILFRTQVNF